MKKISLFAFWFFKHSFWKLTYFVAEIFQEEELSNASVII